MDVLMVLLRLVHFICGVVWAGGAIVMVAYVSPTARAAGDAGRQFMRVFGRQSNFSAGIGVMAVLTSVSGVWMYLRLFGGLARLNSGPGLALTIGGLAGLVALVLGYLTQARNSTRMNALGDEIAKSGGPPAPEQLAEMQAISESMARGGAIQAVLLVIAVLGMSMSEYFAL